MQISGNSLLRVLARIVILATFGLLHGIIHCFISPINWICRPYLNFLQRFQGASFIINAVLIIGVTLSVVGLITLSILSGGTLPAFLMILQPLITGIISAASSLTLWLGSGIIISTLVNGLFITILLGASMAVIQRLIEGSIAFCEDIYYLLTPQKENEWSATAVLKASADKFLLIEIDPILKANSYLYFNTQLANPPLNLEVILDAPDEIVRIIQEARKLKQKRMKIQITQNYLNPIFSNRTIRS